MKCFKCGTNNPADSVFCVSCGAKIEKEDNRSNKKLLIPLIIVSVLCVCTVVSTIILAVLYYDIFTQYEQLDITYNNTKIELENTKKELEQEKDAAEWFIDRYEELRYGN